MTINGVLGLPLVFHAATVEAVEEGIHSNHQFKK
jgi:hypothetical protein